MEMSVPCITNRRKLPVALFSPPGALFLAGDPKAGGDALLALLRIATGQSLHYCQNVSIQTGALALPDLVINAQGPLWLICAGFLLSDCLDCR